MSECINDNERAHSSLKMLEEVNKLLSKKEYEKAEDLIATIPKEQRDAEWHFIEGCILKSKGRFLDAQVQFETAARMSPDNLTYIKAAEELKNSANGYTDTWNTQSSAKKTTKKHICCSNDPSDNCTLCYNCCEWICLCVSEGADICDGCGS